MEDARPNAYGPRKIGQKAFEEAQKNKSLAGRQATKYGSRKTSSPGPRKEGGASANPFITEAGELLTISSLKEQLEATPELLDLAIEAEVQADEPRKGALAALVAAENAREAGPRADVVALLEAAAPTD